MATVIDLWYDIVRYENIHPIRFWSIVILLILLFSALIIAAFRLARKNSSIPAGAVYQASHDENITVDLLKKSKLMKVIIFIQSLIIIGLVIYLANHKLSNHGFRENVALTNSEFIFGLDVNHYNGQIDWAEVSTSKHPIEFIFIRATMGTDGKDRHFEENWAKAKELGYIRGAYHYYRPNEDPELQFRNFEKNVQLSSGDFIPILDVEKMGRKSNKELRNDVLKWLQLAEKRYGVKPMIYTGLRFYQKNFKGYIDEYPLWIAAYSGKHRLDNTDWTFHQFTEKVRVNGIETTVDGNDFNGDSLKLATMLFK